MVIPPETETLKERLGAASGVVAQSRDGLRKSAPDVLFHYTTPQGLVGILGSHRLWATNFRFLNDKSEVIYGVAVFQKVVNERIANTDDPICVEMLSRLLRTANAFEGMLDLYVACFCERDDLLHQWRFYAGAGGGYALGFETKLIGLRWGELHPNQDLILTKVIYDPELQARLISQVVDIALEGLRGVLTQESTVESATFMIAVCCQFVRSHVSDYLVCFKHPAFEVEQEWRLCLTPNFSDAIVPEFRHGPYGLTPYIAVDPSPMVGPTANKLPLSRVVHGPVPDPSNTRFGLSMLLRSNGYHHVELSGCDLPFRLGA